MIRLSTQDLLRYVALPCVLYVVLFFGGSEIIEHAFLNKVDEITIHWLHFARGVFSACFVAALVVFCLSRARLSFNDKMESVCSLLNAANQGLIALDSSGQVVSMNATATELLGSIHSKNFLNWVRNVRSLMQARTEFEYPNPSGHAKLRIVSLQSQERGTLLLLQDITQEKKIEEQWLIAEKMASVGRMAAGLAHEIGTPLNVISGRAELIQAMQPDVCEECQTRPNCAVEKHIGIIFQQIDRITRIIQQLLTQSREPRQQKEAFSINECVLKVVDFLRHLLEKKNIEIMLDLEEELPDLYGFPDQFQQVLINLITNSMDAVEGRHGLIEISTKRNNAGVELCVKDNGHGINEKDLTKIFDPFFTTKEFGKGTGLGLTVTSNIIRAHNGTIDVESAPNQRTQITIHLPAEPPVERRLAISAD